MNDILFIITAVFFGLVQLKNTLFWLSLWQIKEYRLDRLLVHLKETEQGKKLLFGWGNLVKIVLLFLFFITIFTNTSTLYHLLVTFIYFIEFLKVLWSFKQKKLRIPTFTTKVFIIFLAVFEITLISLLIHLIDAFAWLIFIDKITPFIIAGFIALFSFPSDFYKDTVINRAIHKIEQYKKLTIIGITGSYGKGSTKEFTSTILSYKFNVLKTEGTFNTPIGIARTILSGLSSKKQIFIAEMGAYKKGEIAEMANMIKPTIGILTAVNDQHISLFGSLKNTTLAKYELIEALPGNGLALFNGNNSIARELYNKTKRKKALYYAHYPNAHGTRADIVASNIETQKYSIEFEASINGRKIGAFSAPIIGSYNVENILPGIYLGYLMGMKASELKTAVSRIKPIKKTMEPFKNENETTLIDDTFNANPTSVLAALTYLSLYKGKKVLVLQPMIELGKNAREDHRNVAQRIGVLCDYLFVTNANFKKEIQEGIEKSRGQCEVIYDSPLQIAQFVQKNLGRSDIAVFEGKEAYASLRLLEVRPLIE